MSDEATALFMKRFYENLLGEFGGRREGRAPGEGVPKAVALREANQWLRSRSAAAARVRGVHLKSHGFVIQARRRVVSEMAPRLATATTSFFSWSLNRFVRDHSIQSDSLLFSTSLGTWAARQYRRCRAATCGIAMTFPRSGGSTSRSAGALRPTDTCVRERR